MAEYTKNDVVRLGVDIYKGSVENYSAEDSNKVFREALIEANGGSTTLDYKSTRFGQGAKLFSIVEEILKNTAVADLYEDPLVNALVEYRDMSLGDKKEFVVEDSNLYIVSEAAQGTQGIRRQRISGRKSVEVTPTLKVVKIYEELNRILAGKVDLVSMIDNVNHSFRKQFVDDIYKLWAAATSADLGGEAFFPSAGSYDEDALLDVIAHVEAAAGGKKATIIGSNKAVRRLAPAMTGEKGKDDIYNMGYIGKFYGSDVVALPQRHIAGTTNFVYDDDMLTIIAGDDKPIKIVREGNPLIIQGDPMGNADLTQEYMYGEMYGMAIVLAGGNSGIGRYQVTA